MQPFPYQIEPIRVLSEAIRCNRAAIDGSDCGLGKTIVSLMAIKSSGLPAAIICSKSVIPFWRETAAAIGVETVFIANTERLKADQTWIVGDKLRWKWSVPRCVIVYDECHRAASSNSENSAILASAPRPLLMLSATAAPDPTKMRALAHQLGLANWNEWWSWCGRNGCKKGYWGGIEFKGSQEILDRLHRQIFDGHRGIRVRVEDVPNYPENFIETISVPVEDQAAIDKAYQEELEALESQAPNPGVQMLRARQISEHGKLASLMDLTQELVDGGRSVAIFVNFRDSLERLVKKFKCPFIHGEVISDDRAAAIQQFQINAAQVIVVMIAAGGESISLPDLDGQHPRTSLILPGLSARELIQASSRGHRATSKSPSAVKIVFADGTLEDRIRRNLDRKIDGHRVINDGLTDRELHL